MPTKISEGYNVLTHAGARLYYTLYPNEYESDVEPHIYIHLIKVPEESRGLGYASILLKQVIDYADRNQLLIQLEVPWTDYGDTGLSVDELEAWYKRYGFIYDGNLFFNREPRRIKEKKTMRRFEETKIEQGYKDLDWQFEFEGTIDINIILAEEEWLHEVIGGLLADFVHMVDISPTTFEGGEVRVPIEYRSIEAIGVLSLFGWDDLSFSAQSVMAYDIIEEIGEGTLVGSFTVPDFFDEEDY